jgi:Ca2+-binding EF-hand superfamily protein
MATAIFLGKSNFRWPEVCSHTLRCSCREEFLVTISKVPIMYECFATALNLPIGEGESRQEPTALAKSGPVFDFVMLRLIRDNYSIDIAKNRGVAATDTHKKEKHKKRGDAPKVAIQAEGDAEASAKGKPTSILDRAVDRHHFRRLLRDVWKCPDDALYLSDRVFDYMDGDGSGSIDVRELYFGITAALRGSIEHRAEFFYHLFDVEGSGHLKSEEILRMLTASAGSDTVSEEDANAILNAIDSDGSGTVEREEFLAAVHLDPGILDSLSRVFGRQGGNLAGRFKGSEYEDEETSTKPAPMAYARLLQVRRLRSHWKKVPPLPLLPVKQI